MTPKRKRESLTGSKKLKGDEQEIREIKNGLPKVIEYWDMVKQEMDDLLDKARQLT
jgi:hypothetical protein